MAFTNWATSDLITAAKLNNDNSVSVGTDTARTITVTHTWTASQTFTGGLTTGAASTLGGNLLFTDATYDIGASGATRPRDFYLSRNAVIGNNLTTSGTFTHLASAVDTATVLLTTTASMPAAITTDFDGGTHVVVSASAGNVSVFHVAQVGTQTPTIALQRGKGTFGSPTAVLNTDELSALDMGGYDGTDWNNPAVRIIAVATENWSNTAHGSQVVFYTTPNASTTPGSALVLGQDLSATFGGAATIPGTTYIGDTANANITKGLTVNQGAADDQIVAWKSSDVSQGVTDLAEADTFGYIKKVAATTGGTSIVGLSSGTRGLGFAGVHHTDDTAKTTSANGCILFDGLLRSGTSVTTPGADANVVVIRDGSNARFIFDVEGTFHADVASVTF